MTVPRPLPEPRFEPFIEPVLRPVLVVGPRDSGKTAYARAVVERTRAAGFRVAGVLSEAEMDGGRKSRYYARDAARPGERRLLGSVEAAPSLDQRVGRFHMSGAAFASLNRKLMSSLDAELICVDEVGPLEKGGGGFHPALRFLARHYSGILLVTARPSVAAWLEELVRDAAGAGSGRPGTPHSGCSESPDTGPPRGRLLFHRDPACGFARDLIGSGRDPEQHERRSKWGSADWEGWSSG